MAAGVTIRAGDPGLFAAFLEARLAEAVDGARAPDSLGSMGCSPQQAPRRPLSRARTRRPVRRRTTRAVFVFPHHRLVEAREVGSGGHVRIKLRGREGASIGGVAFRAAGQPLGDALTVLRDTISTLLAPFPSIAGAARESRAEYPRRRTPE